MLNFNKFNMHGILLSLIVFSLNISILGIAVPALADDASWTGTFNDLNQVDVEHYDSSPYKGIFTVTATNNTSYIWNDFHFLLFDFGGYLSDVIFKDSSGGGQDPTSSQSGLTWNIFNSGKNIDLFFGTDLVNPGETATFTVYTDNTSNQQPFGVGFYPSIVPEPVSGVLFIIGGATLGFRRFWKKGKST